jgi:hypothetical protein
MPSKISVAERIQRQALDFNVFLFGLKIRRLPERGRTGSIRSRAPILLFLRAFAVITMWKNSRLEALIPQKIG